MTPADLLLAVAKATLLLAPAVAFARHSRRASATARHLVCLAALAAALAIPVLGVVLPARELTALAVPGAARASGIAWLLGAWGAGVLIVLLDRLRSGAALRRLLRRARPLADLRVLRAADAAARETGLEGKVRVVVLPGASVPFVAGILRPVVVVPAEVRRWPGSRLRAVFLHELAHVRRRDPLTQAVADTAVAFWWFHPLAWLAAARMREEREAACDDPVLARGGRASRYAAMLIEVASGPGRAPESVAALGGPHPFERRVRALLGRERRRGGPGRARIAGVFAAAALAALLLAPIRPAAAGAPADSRPHHRHVSVSVSVSASAGAVSSTSATR